MATTSPAAYRAGYQDSPPACPPFPDGVPRQGSRRAAMFYVTYQARGKNEVLIHPHFFQDVPGPNQHLTRT